MWEAKEELRVEKEKKYEVLMDKERKKQIALEDTKKALKELDDVKTLLSYTLTVNDAIDWETLKDKTKYSKKYPNDPVNEEIPIEPTINDEIFKPQLSILDKIIKSSRLKKLAQAKSLFEQKHNEWLNTKIDIENKNKQKNLEYKELVKVWETDKLKFEEEQKLNNEVVDEKKAQYLGKNSDAILEYCDMVLSNSNYPESFPKEYELDYNSENGILIIDYLLPSIENIPNIKEVKYIQSRDQITENYISESEMNKIYDDVIYQIALRTIHEIFEADIVKAISAVVFNGWVQSIDKSTGKEIRPCIASLQVKKDEFLSINLSNVDPKSCFKSLKGISSSRLYSLTPVAPILQINKEDKRFINSYDVVNKIQEGDNLAAMDWEDFEHLIRELFENEFSKDGGEVKVTQASKDGGVDAVVFDPDPIKGGKIIIQAKRYTNTVSVSAVRDLYGTVVNEGAMKGILVTTADYGPDSYEFAKGKPLSLLNGGNLLHLLEKQGHKARIDLKEAKQILKN